MQTVMSMKASGETTKLMDTDPTHTQTAPLMSVTGSMTSSMDEAWKLGPTVPNMTDSTLKERSMDAVP